MEEALPWRNQKDPESLFTVPQKTTGRHDQYPPQTIPAMNDFLEECFKKPQQTLSVKIMKSMDIQH